MEKKRQQLIKEITCNFCNSKNIREMYSITINFFQRKTYVLVECSNCKLHFIDPMPTLEELKPYYSDEYLPFRHFENINTDRFNPWILFIKRKYNFDKMRMFELFISKFFSPYYSLLPKLNPPGKFLDVGCGDGFLITLLNKWGWDTVGIEPSKKIALKISKKGLNVINSDLINTNLQSSSFDVVNFSHVLEHIHNPKEALEKSFDILKKDGWLCIEVPNFDCFQRKILGRYYWYDIPRHLYHFPPRNLKNILAKIGFKNIKSRSYTVNYLVSSYLKFKNRKTDIQSTYKKINPLLKVMFITLSISLSQLNSGDCFEIICQK